MPEYQSREHIAMTATDTPYELLDLGADSNVSKAALSNKIGQIHYVVASDGAATGVGIVFLRLAGAGITEQTIMLAAIGGTLVTGAPNIMAAGVIDVNIPTKLNQDVKLIGEMSGDTGAVGMGITLVYV